MSNLPALKKRRGVARASITRLATRLKDLENDASGPTTLDLAWGITRKLDALHLEFQTHHHAIVDFIDDEEALQKERSTLDKHDDCVAELAACIQQLINVCTSSSDSSPRKIASRRLSRLQKNLSSISTEIATLSRRPDDSCLLVQYEDQLSDCKEFTDVRNNLLLHDLEESDGLSTLLGSLDGKGVKLPKLDVPTFDGNILNWRSFWEQFCVSVHDRSNLSDSEKLVYLQHLLKNGSVKTIIEELSRSGEYYAEAI